MLIAPKEKIIQSYENVIKRKLLDADLITVKLQALVTAGDLTETDIQPLMSLLNPEQNKT